MEMMAKAIEYADVVIIFVSRAYRDSYNCKLEGKYAQVRERAGLTKILFVMMEEDYTPEATGGVDGWLGMLIGDHIYYPGWDPTKLDETVAELCRAVHKMRNETKFPLNTLDPLLSQGKNPRPKVEAKEQVRVCRVCARACAPPRPAVAPPLLLLPVFLRGTR